MSESGDGCILFPMNEKYGRKCSGFCFDQVDACLKIAQLDLSPKHRASFLRTADHWKALANACDGELHPWKSWCYPDTSPGSDICVNHRTRAQRPSES